MIREGGVESTKVSSGVAGQVIGAAVAEEPSGPTSNNSVSPVVAK